MTTSCTYLYGVAPAGTIGHLDAAGIEGQKVRTIVRGELAAIAGTLAPLRLNDLPAAKTLQYLAEHQRVLERALADGPVLPVKFGTCVEDDEAAADVLDGGRAELLRALASCATKVEVDLATFWPDMKAVLADLAGDERVVALKAQIAASGDLSAPQRVRLGQLVKDLLDQRREAISREIAAELRALWTSLILHPVRDDSMILSAALLIDRRHQGRLDQVIAALNGRYDDRLTFRCVGPLPPYSFATAEVQAFGGDQLVAARGTLQLGPAASFAEIKLAYRRRMQECHPDHQGGADSTRQVAEITAAYELLEDYAMNVRHRLGGGRGQGGLAVVKVRSLADLRAQCPAHAA